MKNEILGIVGEQINSNMQRQMSGDGEIQANAIDYLNYTINYYKKTKGLFEDIKEEQTNLKCLINESGALEYMFHMGELNIDNEEEIKMYLRTINEKILSSENFTFHITNNIEPKIKIGYNNIHTDIYHNHKEMSVEYIPSIIVEKLNRIRLTLTGFDYYSRIYKGIFNIYDNGLIQSHFSYSVPYSKKNNEIAANEFSDVVGIDIKRLGEICDFYKNVLKSTTLDEEDDKVKKYTNVNI